MTNPSKVEKLIIKNIKNIEYVEMIAWDKVNYIAGNNWAGKTSVIEAIFQAIDLKRYVESGNARKLIKKWEDKWEITLTISHKGDEIDIVRTFDKEKWVKMTAKSKNWYKLDQTFLNTLLWDFTIDPLAFSRMKASDQINTLKSIAGINTDDIDANIDRLFDDRTHKSRLERELRAIVDKHSDVEEIAKTKSVSELSSKRDDMTNHNYRINYLRRWISEETQKITDYTNQIKQLQKKSHNLNNTLMTIKRSQIKNCTTWLRLTRRSPRSMSTTQKHTGESNIKTKWESTQSQNQSRRDWIKKSKSSDNKSVICI